MSLLYSRTSIPLPRVLSSDSTLDNPLKVPYILMERIEGIPLHHGWHNKSIDPESLANFREKALTDIAKAMVQLNMFTFSKSGAIINKDNLKFGPYRKVDHFADYDLVCAGGEPTTWSEQGPFIHPEEYFLCSLDKEDATSLPYRRQGQRQLLRLLVKWFFEATPADSHSFVLAHPDFDEQNILVGGDGSLKGIVDWDGVAAVPHCIGCEEYPLYLTTDWDPHYWDYDPEKGCITNDNPIAIVPDELNHYRDIYAQKIEAALEDKRYPNRSRTKVSSLARSLYISANEPEALPYNVDMILGKIIDFSEQEDDSSMGSGSVATAVGSDTTVMDVGHNIHKDHDFKASLSPTARLEGGVRTQRR